MTNLWLKLDTCVWKLCFYVQWQKTILCASTIRRKGRQPKPFQESTHRNTNKKTHLTRLTLTRGPKSNWKIMQLMILWFSIYVKSLTPFSFSFCPGCSHVQNVGHKLFPEVFTCELQLHYSQRLVCLGECCDKLRSLEFTWTKRAVIVLFSQGCFSVKCEYEGTEWLICTATGPIAVVWCCVSSWLSR